MGVSFQIVKKLDRFSVDMEYSFEEGVLVIQGESGAGKTTVLNCIAGLKQPDRGRIAIDGRIVFDEKTNVPVKKRQIGYLFQNYALFPNMTVGKNVIYGIKNKEEYRDRKKRKELLEYADYIMDTFQITHLQKRYPEKISGGEKQRVALARAIVTRPKLLLLDEPFSALDMKTKEVVYEEFASLKKSLGIPTILITHDPQESKLFADHKIFMKDGKIV
ncbi:ATP-binding cassette domain-containing protein [Zhenpiania hominis]|uniref:ATP-binding cassette domain-containing protein n=1 Tax=Zhenpiania hominis TaxID=2763644 RepID=A0A923NNP7_9FIRM|nr:ATP-binding cassette domain-containing protein [Zhenpiania hominis]MBC6680477.1 ATP-binding cassette domain-containing protein [Zhenpiania hominis]